MLLYADTRDRLIAKLRQEGIRDEAVLDAMEAIPREDFLSESDLRQEAYIDTALPIECDQTISQPFIVAYMTEKLELRRHDRVLEIGTGSGYQTAILAKLSAHVYTIERHRTLHELAVKRLKKLKFSNVTSIVGDGTKGWPGFKTFDCILVAAAPLYIPRILIEQLAEGGRLIMPVGKPGRQNLFLIRKCEGEEVMRQLLPVRFVPLLAD